MGWLKALRNSTSNSNSESNPPSPHHTSNLKPAVPEISHIEDISIDPVALHASSPKYPFASPNTQNAELPLLTAAEVSGHAANSPTEDQTPSKKLYIVIDHIVYDCTQFVQDHPGGRQVIESFRGQDCSWQFWRFHNASVMHEWGQPLRVARTENVKNRWKEMPRFVGLRRLGASDEDEW